MSGIGIFGGSFNPIHNGHIKLAQIVLKQLELDKIILIPTNISPHKNHAALAGNNDRLTMCRLAVEDLLNPHFEVSSYEIDQRDISYTVNTLRYFTKEYSTYKLYFIMGSDMFLSLKKWYCYEEILSLATIVTAQRQDGDLSALRQYAERFPSHLKQNVRILHIAPYEMSSTTIRECVKNGKDYSCFMPKKVVQYIRNNNLYC